MSEIGDNKGVTLFKVAVWRVRPDDIKEYGSYFVFALDQYKAMDEGIRLAKLTGTFPAYFATIEKAWKGMRYDENK